MSTLMIAGKLTEILQLKSSYKIKKNSLLEWEHSPNMSMIKNLNLVFIVMPVAKLVKVDQEVMDFKKLTLILMLNGSIYNFYF